MHLENFDVELRSKRGRYLLGERGEQVHDRLASEIERAAHHHLGQRDKGRCEEKQRLHAQQVGDHRLPIIGRRDGCAEILDRGEQRVEQQEKPERLSDSERVDRIGLHERARESPAVEKGEEGQHDLRHRKKPVIGGIEQANHE